MAEGLERFLEGRPTLARTPRAAERLARWAKRHPARITVFLLALVTLALVAYQQYELQETRRGVRTEDRRELRRAINRSYEVELQSRIEGGEKRIREGSQSREERRSLGTSYHRLGDVLVNLNQLSATTRLETEAQPR
jgi:hypothetical protein